VRVAGHRLTASALLVVLLSSAPVLAAESPVEDRNDTRGALDVRRVTKIGTTRPRWRIVTWTRWSAARMFDRGYALVLLDTFGTPREDYYALVRSDGSRMRGALYRDRAKRRDRRVAYVRAWRVDRRSLSVRVPLGRLFLAKRRKSYFWRVESLMTGPGCRRVCFDRAPQKGRVEEQLERRDGAPRP
jgi:hypothetical protein